MLKKIPVHVKITIKLYLLLLLIFFVFRILLLLFNLDKLGDTSFIEVLQAFVMGVRFDCVIIGFVIAIPIVALSIFGFIGKMSKTVKTIFTIVLTVLFTITFIVSGADIPYFIQFFDRFNNAAFDWIRNGDSGFIFKMIIEEPRYWLLLLPIGIAVFLFYRVTKKIFERTKQWEKGKYMSKVLFTLCMFGLIFLGMRGRIDEKSPIRVGTAYFCNNALLNQLGLNPNFTLMRSMLDSQKPDNQEFDFMSDQEALDGFQLLSTDTIHNLEYPLSRKIEPKGAPKNYNVILVIMESMSAEKMLHGGNTQNLTPFLDSLATQGLYFENCYTSGMHTYCGVYSSLFSYPVVFRNKPLQHIPILTYNGIASILKENRYTTVYFTTHDSQFDNIGGFLTANGFDRIVSKPDYPREKVKTTLGVPDDYMFEFSIPILNELAQNGKPFFATLMTASDHGPYYLPEYFKPKSTQIKEQMVEYADYALQKFIRLASKEKWFQNTLFVFVADHGAALDADYAIPISYFHTPLLFYAPQYIEPSVNSAISSQMDVFPTIMGILNIPYVNNTFGVDLCRESRPYTYMMSDDKYAILSKEWILIMNPKEQQVGLYKYREKDRTDYSAIFPNIVNNMRQYAEVRWQLSQYILRSKKTNVLDVSQQYLLEAGV